MMMNQKDMVQLKDRLPAIPGINGREDYLNSAVLVLLTEIEREYHFIFQQRSKLIRQGGEVCFPGGRYDEKIDSSMQQTALRETEEEMGITARHIQVIGPLDIVIAPTGIIVEPYLAVTEISDLAQLPINKHEVERIFTLPVSFFRDTPPDVYSAQVKIHPTYTNEDGKEVVLFPGKALGVSDYYLQPWGSGKNTIYVYSTKEGIIWGLTAKIIFNMIQKLT